MPLFLLLAIAVPLALAVAALVLGGPKAPPPMSSILNPFQGLDYSDLPPARFFQARDKARLAYRHYAGGGRGTVVLLHGSGSSGISVHPLARALSSAGWEVYTPDVRGHGESGRRGRVRYIGQLDHDLEDLMAHTAPQGKKVLMGFSSGGGFALRFAGGPGQGLFGATVLLSPFLHPSSPALRPGSGGWVALGLPRLIVLVLLNRLGLTFLNHLPVAAFAFSAREKKLMTPEYSYAMLANFRPREDYRSDIRGAGRPLYVLAGEDDEVFRADCFAEEFGLRRPPAPVTLVPGLGHVGLILDPRGKEAVRGVLDQI